MAESLFVKADEVSEVLGISRAEAYRIIKRLNGELLSHWEMVKNGAKSASNVQAGAFGELDSQDHGLPQQRYDRPGLVSGKRSF